MEIVKIILEYIKVLIWPSIIVFLAIHFKNQITNLIDRIKSAKFPGGVSLEMNDKINEVRELSTKVKESSSEKKDEHKKKPTIPLNKANSRLIELGLQPSPSGIDMNYYRVIANQNPNLSLAGLRIEVDILAKNLATGFKIKFDSKRGSAGNLLNKLVDQGAITRDQFQLAKNVVALCNQAVHGVIITHEQALSIIDSADVLIEDYLAWMSWGFDDKWKS